MIARGAAIAFERDRPVPMLCSEVSFTSTFVVAEPIFQRLGGAQIHVLV